MNASECSLSCKHMKDFYTPGPEIGKKLASAGRSERKLTNIRTKRFDLCVFEISKQLSVRCQIVSNCLGMKLQETYLSSLSFLMELFSLAFSASPWAQKDG